MYIYIIEIKTWIYIFIRFKSQSYLACIYSYIKNENKSDSISQLHLKVSVSGLHCI